jgi:hypothetical protein
MACRWRAIERKRRWKYDARRDCRIVGAVKDDVRSTGMALAPSPPPLADAEQPAIKDGDFNKSSDSIMNC